MAITPNPALLDNLEDDLHLTEAQAARIVGVQPITLRMWRWRDRKRPAGTAAKSPPYVVTGTRSIRYPLAKLRAWLRALPSVDGIPQLPDNRRGTTPSAPLNAPAAAAV